MKIGRWTIGVIYYRNGVKVANCQCDCGTQSIVNYSNMKRGVSRSCGCLAREATFKHGDTKTAEYRAWQHMLERCHGKRYLDFKNYGGRGITVCAAWRASYAVFLSDMGRRPSPHHSIHRIDNDGNYTPDNCKWATLAEQSTNKRTNRMLKWDGDAKPLKTWARLLGINCSTLSKRLTRSGWSIEKALTTHVHKRNSH